MEQRLFNRIYSIGEFYIALLFALRTLKYYRRSKKEISYEFSERIMLAVTEVNGCEVCSYVHTKIALENGMSKEEVHSILSGSSKTIPEEELTAVLFAQHYADSRGYPSVTTWNRVVDEFGEIKALGILGVVRMMMVANIYGIAMSSLRRRLKGNQVKKSNLLYEIGMLLSIVIYLPAAALHAFVSNILKRPLIKFK